MCSLYRPPWWPRNEHDSIREIAEMAADVHSTLRGSFDRHASEQLDDVKALKWILNNWLQPTSEFDAAIRALVRAAIEEVHEHEVEKQRKAWNRT